MPKLPPKTCQELMDLIDRLAPGPAMNSIFKQLEWQRDHGRRPGHLRQYLEAAYYQQYPRERVNPDAKAAQAKLLALANGLTKPVPSGMRTR